MLVRARLTAVSGRDTAGDFVVDTGAGFLALDLDLARALGVADSAAASPAIGLASHPLPRLELGSLELERVSPVLTIGAEVVRRATGRPVLGLLGQAPFADRTIIVDYREGVLVLLPPGFEGEQTGRSPRANRETEADRARPAASGASASVAADSAASRVEPGRSGSGDSTVHASRAPQAADSAASHLEAGSSGPGDSAASARGPNAPREADSVEGRARPDWGTPPPAFSPGAVAVPFRVAGDRKLLVRARVETGSGARSVDLIVDTGATKSVFFSEALSRKVPEWRGWPGLRGLAAPTLTGDAAAAIVRVPALALRGGAREVQRRGMDVAVIQGGLGEDLADEVGAPVDGLLGYNFLKHFRLAFDASHGLLWLDPTQGDVPDRPFEFSSVGVQLEDARGVARVAGVAVGSSAARAGVRAGDALLAIDGRPVGGGQIVAAAEQLEGPPGTSTKLTLRRARRQWTCTLVRTRLL